jgi:hypothetical protein
MDGTWQRNGKPAEKQGRKVTDLRGTGWVRPTRTLRWLDRLLLSYNQVTGGYNLES